MSPTSGPYISLGLLLDLNPFLVPQEFLPTIGHGFPVGPFEQIDELDSIVFFRFPGGNYLEVIPRHDTQGMISKSVVKRSFVAIKYFVNPELMNNTLLFRRP